jgi:hypothetical protein
VRDRYRTYVTNVIPELTEVRFYESTRRHVNVEHPDVRVELPAVQTAIENALRDPTRIEQRRPGSYVFVDEKSANRAGDSIRVVVKHVTATSGRVTTVFFASSRRSARIVWPPPMTS